MSDYHAGLFLIPMHMYPAVKNWVERCEPDPCLMGSFFRAVLCNDLMTAAAHADTQNRYSLADWGVFVYNFLPSDAWGSLEIIEKRWLDWHNPE